jgi:PAS domain S-box-containing protein
MTWTETRLDGAIGAALGLMALALLLLARRKADMSLRWAVVALAAALGAPAGLFLASALGLPVSGAGVGKTAAAVVCGLAAILVLAAYPKAAGMRSPVDAETVQLMLERDIAERKAAAERLIRVASFPEQTPNPFVQTDLAGKVVYANPEALRRFPDLADSGPRHPVLCGIGEIIREFRTGQCESAGRELDLGHTVFQQKFCYLLQRGQVAVYMTDITDLRRTQDGLRASEERFRLLFEEAPVAYHEIDRDGVIRRVNRAECELLGFSADAILGRPVWNFVAPEERQATREATLARMSGQVPLTVACRTYLTALGKRLAVEIHENFIRDGAGEIAGIRGALLDVTERRRAEEESRRMREAAEAASRAKSDFVANMSHEVRTPLNAIVGMTELALGTRLTDEQREYMAAVKNAADALLAVINDILDFAKIEAGKLELDPIDFPLRDTVDDAIGVLSLRAHQKGLELICRVAPDVPDDLVGDPDRVRQVLINLVGNAIKFTERGEVAVSVTVEPAADSEIGLHFVVRDTGIGIPEEKQRAIFDAFQQADGSTTRRYGGTGLGLTISARLVELMGGRIWVESSPGQGSAFHFTAGFGRAAPPAQAASGRRPVFPEVSALVVDDNPTSRMVIEETLRAWGLGATSVPSAEAAWLAITSAHEHNRSFRLLVIDVDLGGSDGFSLAERVLLADLDPEVPSRQRAAPLMLLPAGQLSQIGRCLELGLPHVIKPVKHSALLAAVCKALGVAPPAGESEPEPAQTAERQFRPLHVLLAEDNPVNQLLARRLLERRGHLVTVVGNGREALHALEGGSFDVVLMDVQMPEMGGFDATAAIRQREQHSGGHIPIIAMTAHALPDDRERCLQAGMDGYVVKPIEAGELLRSVEEQGGLAPAAVPAAPVSRPAGPLVDRQQLLARLAGSSDLLKEITDIFLAEGPRLLARAKETLAAADGIGLYRAAHALKGVLRNLSADAAGDLAQRLEDAARAGDFPEAGRLLADLNRAVELIEHELLDLHKEKAP